MTDTQLEAIAKILGKKKPQPEVQSTDLEKILSIQMYFDDRPEANFDLSFINKIEDQLIMGRELTAKQSVAIDNIMIILL